MRLAACLLIALLLTGCAHRPGAGSLGDAVTTYAALSSSGFEEANPLLDVGSPLGSAVGSIVLKQGLKYGLTGLGVPHCDAHRGVETAGMGATGWNLAMMAGAGPPGRYSLANRLSDRGILAAKTDYQLTDPASERGFSCREASHDSNRTHRDARCRRHPRYGAAG